MKKKRKNKVLKPKDFRAFLSKQAIENRGNFFISARAIDNDEKVIKEALFYPQNGISVICVVRRVYKMPYSHSFFRVRGGEIMRFSSISLVVFKQIIKSFK